MNKIFSLALTVTILTFIVGTFHLNYGQAEIPEKLVTKLNLDAYPWLFVFLLPVYGTLVSGLIVLIKRKTIFAFHQENTANKDGPRLSGFINHKHQSTVAICILFGPFLALIMQSVMLMVDAGWLGKQSISHAAIILMLSYTFFMGNTITTTRRDSGAGFRTPWSLTNDAIWVKTQRYLGRCLVAFSLFGVIGLFFFASKQYFLIFIPILVTIKISAAIYSWLLWRHEQHQKI